MKFKPTSNNKQFKVSLIMESKKKIIIAGAVVGTMALLRYYMGASWCMASRPLALQTAVITDGCHHLGREVALGLAK